MQPPASSGVETDQPATGEQPAELDGKLAAVPDQEFEEALTDPTTKPTTIINANAKPKSNQVSKEALWLQGWLQEFECEDVAKPAILDRDLKDIMATMTPEMLDNVHRLAPRIANWLNQIGASHENVSGRLS